MHKRTTSKHRLMRLTMARTWGKPPPIPLIVFFVPHHEAYTQRSFCPKNPKILKIEILAILNAHNFSCKSLIEVRFKAKLYPLSKAFQRYVAYHFHVSKSGRFLTFNDQESNWQVDFRPFFWP